MWVVWVGLWVYGLCVSVGWVGLGWVELGVGWVGLDWVVGRGGVKWVGLDWDDDN